ncbi:GNAT family N-acetyltransferase [Dysgonomonas sp. Marseille-P4677]|uniref:GNAT family N-acetyltransferase n=1 Tax=Dysgonomonas sp. Marseille-P4677 TaxID=2364790 RepID=UPI001914C15F|nr:GNAT family N-acetyltransferase [Dysgonomonas sp. Marseille-P4677]MBK5722842.1 GNAT family N-acetyltransferase [Dysgonomonas sp. Marseille-P4677]
MNLRYQTNLLDIPWERIPQLLKAVGMSFTDVEKHKISFETSYSTIFVFDDDKLIGIGRLLSDGVRQSAIYDIAVDPNYQGRKIGQEIVKRLMSTTPDCNFILYASPGKEGFYKKMNFKKMKTGMALFTNPERMVDNGFIEE